MYERMLTREVKPTMEEMQQYCKEASNLFGEINEWFTDNCITEQTIVYPYGRHYGWGIAHKRNGKLFCNVFAEQGAFTVMVRLTNQQFAKVYDKLSDYSKALVDRKYPSERGGWIHYRVLKQEHIKDIELLLESKMVSI